MSATEGPITRSGCTITVWSTVAATGVSVCATSRMLRSAVPFSLPDSTPATLPTSSMEQSEYPSSANRSCTNAARASSPKVGAGISAIIARVASSTSCSPCSASGNSPTRCTMLSNPVTLASLTSGNVSAVPLRDHTHAVPGFPLQRAPGTAGLGRYLDSAAGSVAASLRGSSKNGLTTRSRPNFWPCCR